LNIDSGSSTTLNWSADNATSCSASGGWTGSKVLSGSESFAPTSDTTYSLSTNAFVQRRR
jgi:chitinase